MLVLILAVSHPAFSIEQKEKLRQIFETIKKEVHQVQQVPQAAAAAAPSAAPRYDTTVPYSPVYQENDCHFFVCRHAVVMKVFQAIQVTITDKTRKGPCRVFVICAPINVYDS